MRPRKRRDPRCTLAARLHGRLIGKSGDRGLA